MECVPPMPHESTLPDGHVLSDDRGRLDLVMVHRWLTDLAPWARGRPLALTRRCWANCLCFGVHAPDGSLAGFGRLLTDYTFRAHLGDLMILPEHRGRGLGKALVDFILGHPELITVQNWTLTTDDAHGLYARHGFETGTDGKWMTLNRRLA